MATDTLSERLSTKLHLQTKKVGEDRIRRAKEKDEDIAIFSMFSLEGDPKFRCCLGKDCLLGDPKKADPGDENDKRPSFLFFNDLLYKNSNENKTFWEVSCSTFRVDLGGRCKTTRCTRGRRIRFRSQVFLRSTSARRSWVDVAQPARDKLSDRTDSRRIVQQRKEKGMRERKKNKIRGKVGIRREPWPYVETRARPHSSIVRGYICLVNQVNCPWLDQPYSS